MTPSGEGFATQHPSTRSADTYAATLLVGPRGRTFWSLRPCRFGRVGAVMIATSTGVEGVRPRRSPSAEGSADLVTALSLSSSQEAIGIVRAASSAGLPVAISFTVWNDRRLGGGETLREAIETVDDATGSAAAYFMINCSHPVDFGPALEDEDWVTRVGGFRANASKEEHSILSLTDHLDEGNPDELAGQYAQLRSRFPHMNVFGGCCGTDLTHLHKISTALQAAST